MGIEIILVLCIIGLALVLFVSEVIPIDLTAILIMIVLMLLGLVTPEEGFSGFSNIATATILALLILTEGLRQTGVVEFIGTSLKPIAGKNKYITLLTLMLITAVLSAFINNTAVVAIFIPIVIQLAKHNKTSPSFYLMPLSFAAMAGGSSTLIGSSTNLLVEDIAKSHGIDTLSMFSFSAMGAIIVLTVVLFFILIGKLILPKRAPSKENLTTSYEEPEYITEIEVMEGSNLIGKKLADTALVKQGGIQVLKVVGKNNKKWIPDELEELREGDILMVQANQNKIVEIAKTDGLSIRKEISISEHQLSEKGGALVELLVGPSSNIAGFSLSWQGFKNKYGAIPIAIRKRTKMMYNFFTGRKLQFGDVILAQAKDANINRFYDSNDLVVLSVLSEQELENRAIDKKKGLLAASIMVIAIILAATGILPIVVSTWAGCAAMVLLGCLSLKAAYSNIQWNVIFLLAGIIPLGIAMENTGTSALLAEKLNLLIGGFGIHGVVASLFLGTVLLTGIMSNNATAILVAPIAIEVGQSLNIPIEPLLITVLLAANSSFITPVGYQTNTMIYGPGNYKFSDLLKIGAPLTLLILALVTYFVPLLYGGNP